MAKYAEFKYGEEEYGAAVSINPGTPPWASWYADLRASHVQAFDVVLLRLAPINPRPGYCTTNVIDDDTIPVPVIEVTPTELLDVDWMKYDGTRSYDPDSSDPVTFSWNFGGEDWSNLSVGSYQFSTTGEKEVKLIVTDSQGFHGQDSVFVRVTEAIAGLWDGKAYVATKGDGLYYTDDGGVTWMAKRGNLTGDALTVNDMAFGRDSVPYHAYIATTASLYYEVSGPDRGQWTTPNLHNPTNLAGDSPAPTLDDLEWVGIVADGAPYVGGITRTHAAAIATMGSGASQRAWLYYRLTASDYFTPRQLRYNGSYAIQPISIAMKSYGYYIYVTARDNASGDFFLQRFLSYNPATYSTVQNYSGGTTMRVKVVRGSYYDDDRVFLYGNFGGYNLLISTNSGASFIQIDPGTWGTNEAVLLGLPSSSYDRLTVALNTLRDLYYTDSQGETWIKIADLSFDVEGNVGLPAITSARQAAAEELLFGNASTGQIIYTPNHGVSQADRSTGLPAYGISAFGPIRAG